MMATNWISKLTRQATIRKRVSCYASAILFASEVKRFGAIKMSIRDSERLEEVKVFMSPEEAEKLAGWLLESASEYRASEARRAAYQGMPS